MEDAMEENRNADVRRVEMFTIRELLQTIVKIQLPLWVIDVIYWRDVVLSAICFIGGLAAIGVVADLVTFKHIAGLVLMVLGHVMWYTALSWFFQVPPLEVVLENLGFLMLSPGAVHSIRCLALKVTHWIKRWKATIMHLLLGTQINNIILIVLLMIELRVILWYISFEKVVKILYCGVFLMPILYEEATWKLYKYYFSPEPTNGVLFQFLTVILMCKELLLMSINDGTIEIHGFVEETRRFHLRNQALIIARLMQLARIETVLLLEEIDEDN